MNYLTFIYEPGEAADVEYAVNQNFHCKIVDIVARIAKNGEERQKNVWFFENEDNIVLSIYAGEPGNFKLGCKVRFENVNNVPEEYVERYYKDGWLNVYGFECKDGQPKLLNYADNRSYGENGWLLKIIRYAR